MKNTFTKIFALLCGIIFIAEGAILLQVYFGKLHPHDIIQLFNLLVSKQIHLHYLLGISLGFILSGLIFLRIFIGKKRSSIDDITINKKGEVIRIPAEAIKEVVQQIISLNSHFTDVGIEIRKIKKWINIELCCAYAGNESIPKKINEIKEIIRGEMMRVFDFRYLKINFQLDGVTLEHSSGMQENEEGLENDLDLGEATKPAANSVLGQEELNSEIPPAIRQEETNPNILEKKKAPPAAKTKPAKRMPWEK